MTATRIISSVLGAFLLFAVSWMAPAPAAAQPRESRYAAIVIDANSGDVLYAVNPDRRSYPASLTKVMTLYLMFDALDSGRMSLATTMGVSAHAAAQAPSKLGLRPGERISVEDAVLALVTKSANDVAVVIAEALGGSEAAFAGMMTRKAHQLGMHATTYQNASGLPDLDQISTPRDQALLGRAIARTHARHYHYFSTRQFKWRGQPISTHNRLMLRYQGADGIKTGYINASGFNLLASAKRDGRRIVGVVFGGDTAAGRDRNMAQILDKGFARIKGGDHGIRSAQAEAEDRADLDSLIAATQTGMGTGKSVTMAGVRHGEDLGSGDLESDNWAIQVGAFSSQKPAHQAASAAASKLGGLISGAAIDIDKVKLGKAPTFRARLTGFTEDQARAACKRLAKVKKDCKLVQPSS